MLWAKNKHGFTIVELLIVVVVIAILAAITIVSFNGIQARASISRVNSDLTQINKALGAYYALKGSYPVTTGWRSQSDSSKDTFIPGLVPEVVPSLPRSLQWAGAPTFYYISLDGIEYKLLYLYPSNETIPSAAASNDIVQNMIDPKRTTRGWGYWTSGAATATSY